MLRDEDALTQGAHAAIWRLSGDLADEAVQTAVARTLFEIDRPYEGKVDWRGLPDHDPHLWLMYIQRAERVLDTVAEALTGVLAFDGILPASELTDRLASTTKGAPDAEH